MAAIESLELFKQYSRTEYEQAFGEQPPPFDAARPDKLWFDKSETAGNYLRISRDDSGKPSIVPMTMTRELAASVNIPGAYRWPAYVPAPTDAVAEFRDQNGKLVAAVPVAPGDLTTAADAAAIAKEVGGTVQADASWAAASVKWPAGELRRLYLVQAGEYIYNAGQLLQMKYINGVGAAGKWLLDTAGLRWVPAAVVTAQIDPKVKPIPVPCRELAADEEFRQGFAGWTVEKKTPPAAADEAVRLLKLICQTFRISF